MRITSSMYYKTLYADSNSQINQKMFDVNKQIASGLAIQYASDDVSAFTETMRLDNELVTIRQIKKSTESGYKISNQTDVILNDFEESIGRMRTLLIQSASDTNDTLSRSAIAAEMRGLEEHFKNLANTSINGQYLFSGSAIDVKPINDDGTYNGNNVGLKAFVGSHNEQQYNLSGADLFLGEEVLRKREIVSNVVNFNLSSAYADFTSATASAAKRAVVSSDTIRDMMGDSDNVVDTVNAKHIFYLRGTKTDGESFNAKIAMRDDETIDDLLKRIGDAFGNKPDLQFVNVSLNGNGEIVIQDKVNGSSKLDFHLVGATDYNYAGVGVNSADVTNITALDSGESNFDKIILGTSTAANPNLFVKEFMRLGQSPAAGGATNIRALNYDMVEFDKNGAKLSANVPQVLKDGNAFATASTKLSEVADLSKGTAGTLDGTQFTLSGLDVNGTAFKVQIDLQAGGSTFSLDGGVTNYSIFNVGTPRSAVAADDMTYKQLMDVVNMALTDSYPLTTNDPNTYDAAVTNADNAGNLYLSYDGKIQFEQRNASYTKATLAIYDSNSGDFSADASVMTFNSNKALTIQDPKTDFFKTLDQIITAVENHQNYPDADSADALSVGIQNAISMVDSLQDHIYKAHALVGARSNSLTKAMERTDLLEVSTMSLRSSVVDTDLAKASLTLTQLTTNYQAMLSTVGKVSKLSLLNYI
ncbi:MAG: flagellar biosynthesis protein FlgL [Epsilonproteobacteria bacterium]|nr:flagellar biosynthesis protein FlgL [Campylobacterota bacterium]